MLTFTHQLQPRLTNRATQTLQRAAEGSCARGPRREWTVLTGPAARFRPLRGSSSGLRRLRSPEWLCLAEALAGSSVIRQGTAWVTTRMRSTPGDVLGRPGVLVQPMSAPI